MEYNLIHILAVVFVVVLFSFNHITLIHGYKKTSYKHSMYNIWH